MKVTFVTDTYTPQANGVATTLEHLVFGLRERGHTVDVVRPAVLACDEEGLEVPSFGFPGYREVRFGFPMKLVFIFPSITETFGNVTLEAMASGLAVVAYNYAAARQHIVSGVNGFTAPFNDRQAYLGLAIEAAATDLAAIREEARGAARKVRWKKVLKRFEIQLQGLADGEPFEREAEVLVTN